MDHITCFYGFQQALLCCKCCQHEVVVYCITCSVQVMKTNNNFNFNYGAIHICVSGEFSASFRLVYSSPAIIANI